jgi:hypothetical protein
MRTPLKTLLAAAATFTAAAAILTAPVTAAHAAATHADTTTSPRQLIDDSRYWLSWGKTGFAVDSLGTQVWETLALTPYAGNTSQQWEFLQADTSGTLWDVNMASGLCRVTGGAAQPNDPVVQGECGLNGYSEWYNIPGTGSRVGQWKLVNVASGLCVGIGPTNAAGQPTLNLTGCSRAAWFIYHSVT